MQTVKDNATQMTFLHIFVFFFCFNLSFSIQRAMQIPTCPISQLPMTDPVMDHEGNSYERDSILIWLRSNQISPITRSPLTASQLRPNRALKEFIESQSQSQSTPTATAPPTENTTSDIHFLPATTIESACFVAVEDKTQIAIKVKDSLQSTERLPIDIVCVIDVSASMNAAATFKDQNAQIEDTGLSILDVVKHSLRTTLASLQDQDRMALVTFSNSATKICDLTFMTSQNKTIMTQHIDTMQSQNSTNIWDGIHKACHCYLHPIADRVEEARSRAIFLFTDGLPNISPPRGELQTLKNYLDTNHDYLLPFALHTFGFGYEMDSKLLHFLAMETGGTFSFIPDAGFVGTVMIHRLANLLSTVVTKAYLQVENAVNHESCLFPIGGLLLGQERTYTIPFKICDNAMLRLNADQLKLSNNRQHCAWFDAQCQNTETFRHAITTTLLDFANSDPTDSDLSTMKSRISSMTETIPNSDQAKHWKHDLKNEILLALTPEYYRRWGSHYIRSFARAHQVQQANNFKDESIQRYGGLRFTQERDRLDKIFLDLPAVRPSRSTRTQLTRGGSMQTVSSTPVSMNLYHSSANVCILEGALVHMENGKKQLIEKLQRGDILCDGDTIDCVVVNLVDYPFLVQMKSGFLITQYHPIQEGERWVFPKDSDKVYDSYTSPHKNQKLFSLLTKKRQPVRVGNGNGIQCATLGHGDLTSAVIGHPYFGSAKVIEHITSAKDYQQGKVYVKKIIRTNNKDNLVCGLEFR